MVTLTVVFSGLSNTIFYRMGGEIELKAAVCIFVDGAHDASSLPFPTNSFHPNGHS